MLDNLSTGRLESIEHLRQRDDVEFVLGSILNADLVDRERSTTLRALSSSVS